MFLEKIKPALSNSRLSVKSFYILRKTRGINFIKRGRDLIEFTTTE